VYACAAVRAPLLVSVLSVAALQAKTTAAQPAPAEPAPQAPTPAEAPVIVPPKLLSDPAVSYPEGAAGDARVVLVLLIDKAGAVRSATPNEPNEPFSSRAANAALAWRFEPATRDGKPVAARILIEVVFREPEPPAAEAVEEAPPQAAPAKAPRPDEQPLEVLVVGERAEPGRSATLSRAEVRQLPGAFGDPFRAIESLPGVTPIVSGLPFFFVRGAPPGNVGYFLDGIRVPLLFHVGVGPSVIHPALIERVDLYPGGYPARYGRFAGGIVAGETAPPLDELHGEYNVRLFDAGALAEAPFADGRGTVLLGGRYSYTALLFSILSPETSLEYWDYQARLSYDVTRDDRLGLFAFGSYDHLGQKTQTETLTAFGTQFHRVDLRYDRSLGGRGTMRTAVTGGIDRSTVQQTRAVVDRIFAARNEIEWQESEDVTFRAGTDVQTDTYEIELGPTDISRSASRAASFFPSRTDLAVGAWSDVVARVHPAVEVTPGVRIDLYESDGETAAALEPRLAVRTELSERVALLTALGIAHQAPAFVVPVPGIQPGGLRGGLQRAFQESVGVEVDLGESTTLTATTFQNAFFQMSDPLGVSIPQINGCPPGFYPGDTLGGDRFTQPDDSSRCGVLHLPPAGAMEPGKLGPDRSGGGGQGADSAGGARAVSAFEVRTLGSSYGIELYLKRQLTKRFGGFLSYTLSRSTRSYGRRTFIAAFDRTHVANAAVAFDLGRRWRAGSRVVFYTGLPKAPDPTDPDSTRLPPFFRVDLRVEKRWQLTKKAWIALVGEWMNATLSKEAVTTTCNLNGCEAQTIGPVTIPSLGVEGGF
jgi:hypothetical protein